MPEVRLAISAQFAYRMKIALVNLVFFYGTLAIPNQVSSKAPNAVHKKDKLFQSSVFNTGNRSASEETIQLNVQSVATEQNVQAPIDSNLSLKVIELRINSFSSLISTAAKNANLADIYLSRGTLYLQRANVLRRNKKISEDLADTEIKSLKLSRSDVTTSITKYKLKPETHAYAEYLLALIAVDLGEMEKATTHFQKSLSIDASSPLAASIVFFMSEQYFKDGKPLRSYDLLKKYQPKMKGDNLPLALYKMAWSLLSARRMKNAENTFIQLLKEHPKSRYAEVAVREISLVSSELRSEAQILKLADELFATNQIGRVEFLSSVYSNMRRKDQANPLKDILAQLLKVADSPQKRIQLWLEEMKASERQYASEAYQAAFLSLKQEYQKFSGDWRKEPLFPAIKDEVSRLVASFLQTYSKQVPNEEQLAESTIAEALIIQLDFFATNLAADEEMSPVVTIWLDVASLSQNHTQVIRVADQILANSQMDASLKNKARLEKIVSLSHSPEGGPEKQRSLLLALDEYLSDGSVTRWRELANRRVDILFELDEKPKAIEKLIQLHSMYKDSESLDRLLAGLFSETRYTDVISQITRNKAIKPTENSQKIYQESLLQLAVQNKESDKKKYEEYLKMYLESTKDRQKKSLVIADFLSDLAKNKNWRSLATEIHKFKDYTAEIEDPLLKLADEYFMTGKWKTLTELLNLRKTPYKNTQLNFYRVVLNYASEFNIDSSHIQALGAAEKTFLIHTLALGDPTKLLEEPTRKAWDPGNNSLWLAMQVKYKSFTPAPPDGQNSSETKLLAQLQNGRQSALEKDLISLSESIGDKENIELNEKLVQSIEKARKLRSQLTSNMAKLEFSDQLRLLNQISSTEGRLARQISRVQIPKELPPQEAREFRQQMSDLYKEFIDQLKVYYTARTDLTIKSVGSISSYDQRKPASKALLPWPNTSAYTRFAKFLSAKKPKSVSLIYVDVLLNQGRISSEEYHHLRTKIFAEMLPNEVVKYMYRTELKAQDNKKWESVWTQL